MPRLEFRAEVHQKETRIMALYPPVKTAWS